LCDACVIVFVMSLHSAFAGLYAEGAQEGVCWTVDTDAVQLEGGMRTRGALASENANEIANKIANKIANYIANEIAN